MDSPLRKIPRVATAIFLSFGPLYAIAQMPPAEDDSLAHPSDNTGANVRDRTSAAVRDRTSAAIKPTDQPNDAVDIKMAAAVRRSINSENSLSTLAHNVKLVASAGVVTLRGPVMSEAEKAKVERLASATPGVTAVHNELDIR